MWKFVAVVITALLMSEAARCQHNNSRRSGYGEMVLIHVARGHGPARKSLSMHGYRWSGLVDSYPAS